MEELDSLELDTVEVDGMLEAVEDTGDMVKSWTKVPETAMKTFRLLSKMIATFFGMTLDDWVVWCDEYERGGVEEVRWRRRGGRAEYKGRRAAKPSPIPVQVHPEWPLLVSRSPPIGLDQLL